MKEYGQSKFWTNLKILPADGIRKSWHGFSTEFESKILALSYLDISKHCDINPAVIKDIHVQHENRMVNENSPISYLQKMVRALPFSVSWESAFLHWPNDFRASHPITGIRFPIIKHAYMNSVKTSIVNIVLQLAPELATFVFAIICWNIFL